VTIYHHYRHNLWQTSTGTAKKKRWH